MLKEPNDKGHSLFKVQCIQWDPIIERAEERFANVFQDSSGEGVLFPRNCFTIKSRS